jgi:putative restriction endonuclease
VLGARLDEELYALLGIKASRDLLRVALIQTYFAPELRPKLLEQGAVNAESFRHSQKLLEKARRAGVKEELDGQSL